MIVIGVVGGIASGKSLVAAQFQRLGAQLLDADKAGHRALTQADTIDALTGRWGDRVLKSDGSVDRRAVAEIVFAPPPDGPPELQFLESITHPKIGTIVQRQINEFDRAGAAAAVLDAALIFEAGWHDMCDFIVFVDVPQAARLARAIDRGWSETDFDAREAAQDPLDSKRAKADFVIDNSLSQENTFKQTQRIWNEICSP